MLSRLPVIVTAILAILALPVPDSADSNRAARCLRASARRANSAAGRGGSLGLPLGVMVRPAPWKKIGIPGGKAAGARSGERIAFAF